MSRRLVWKLLRRGVVLAGLVAGTGWLILTCAGRPLIANPENSSRVLLDRHGSLMRVTLTGDEKYRVWTPRDSFSADAREAVIDYEDRWFYSHPGVNLVALGRAALQTVLGSGRLIGGSTITMQLARKRWQLQTRSIAGKVRQMLYAFWIEHYYTKDEILEAYLNTTPYGANIEGIAAASWIYFHKSPRALSAAEARALALIPQNPVRRAPLTAAGYRTLQDQWRRQFDGGGERALVVRTRAELPHEAPHFSERLGELVRQRGELVTSLSLPLQHAAERALAEFVRRNSSLGIQNGTVLVVDTRTMEVLAYVGSADYRNPAIDGYVNGLEARRSPGSALKPFIYALALDQGLITPDTLLKDTPLRLANYQPENFERNFLGPLPATAALVRSRNIPAITLAGQLARPSLYTFFQGAGLYLPKPERYYGLSLALGSFEVSMEEIATLYAALVRGGVTDELSFLRHDPEESRFTGPAVQQLLSPEAAFLTREMLKKNPPPAQQFGSRQFSSGPKVAWKTGTSFGSKDAWAIGMTGAYVVGVWVGNFDATPNPNFVGRDAAGPLLFSVIDGLRAEQPLPPAQSLPARNLKRVEICPISGALRSPHCPHSKEGWIIPGVSPIAPCAVHREVFIDSATGLRLCSTKEGAQVTRTVMEVWDSDVLELFRQAGLARTVAPPFKEACNGGSEGALRNSGPRIVSPQVNVTYHTRQHESSQIEFSAVADGSRNKLFWFVNDGLIGEGTTVFWDGRPGDFMVRVVDDQGLAAERKLRVIPAQ